MKRNLLSLAVAIVAIASAQAQVPANAIAGKFSVAADKQVYFSKGNLQYTQSTRTWVFAEHQTDIIGEANLIIAAAESENTLADKIDLFGWSTNNPMTPFGVSISTVRDYYRGDFVDWGTNIISGDAANTWRTLAANEWEYLFLTRTNADKLFALAIVDGTNGLILLPDGWTTPDGVTFTPSTDKGMVLWMESNGHKLYGDSTTKTNHYTDNVYTAAEWQKMETTGAVFLPVAGHRQGTSPNRLEAGEYWSATPVTTTGDFAGEMAGYCEFAHYEDWGAVLDPNYTGWSFCSWGRSVRLVKDYSGVNTGIVNPSATNTEVRKIIRNGQVLIKRGGKTYTLTGVEVK